MQLFTFHFKAMGGPCKVCVYENDESIAETLFQKAQAEVLRLETKYSRYLSDSIISQINQSAGQNDSILLDEETAQLLAFANTAFQQSDGLFDITSGVLRKAWDFKGGNIPTQNHLDELLLLVGWQKVAFSGSHIRLPVKGMEIDFGGFVKEYAVDCAISVIEKHMLGKPVKALVDLAGDIAVTSFANQEPWSVGIRDPKSPEEALAAIGLESGAIASSGNYERYIDKDNQRYCHILNPLTGWPVLDGMASVSVKAEQCMIAGVISTVAMLKPRKEAEKWLKSLECIYLAIDKYNEISGTYKK